MGHEEKKKTRDWRKESVEKALALVRQGWDIFCLEELEKLLARWDDPDPSQIDEEELDTIELCLPPKTPEPELPKIEVAHDGSSVTIEDGWAIDDDYLEYMIWNLKKVPLREVTKDPVILVRETKSLVREGIKIGKVRRVDP